MSQQLLLPPSNNVQAGPVRRPVRRQACLPAALILLAPMSTRYEPIHWQKTLQLRSEEPQPKLGGPL